jgi:hypothetical protein
MFTQHRVSVTAHQAQLRDRGPEPIAESSDAFRVEGNTAEIVEPSPLTQAHEWDEARHIWAAHDAGSCSGEAPQTNTTLAAQPVVDDAFKRSEAGLEAVRHSEAGIHLLQDLDDATRQMQPESVMLSASLLPSAAGDAAAATTSSHLPDADFVSGLTSCAIVEQQPVESGEVTKTVKKVRQRPGRFGRSVRKQGSRKGARRA